MKDAVNTAFYIDRNSMANFTIAPPSQPAGAYYIGAFHIGQMKKPNILHRFFMRILLGFKWKDAK